MTNHKGEIFTEVHINGFKIAFMTHKQNHRNKNKEQKHTCNSVVLINYSIANKKRDTNLLLIMGREKIDQKNKQCLYLQKIYRKKKKERERSPK